VSNQRKEFWHQATRFLADNYGTIAIEDLSLGFMTRNDHLAQAAHDIGLGMFRNLLGYKAIEAGVEVIEVNPRNTSQACSRCGSIVRKELNERIHQCPECGLELDRDLNAAINILSLGTREWALI
jgi:putative transposase